jgi:hypothetical protein
MIDHEDKRSADTAAFAPSAALPAEPVSHEAGQALNGGPVDAREANGTAPIPEGPGWRAEAGRKGAQRIHELIQHGRLYEQEHGLKSGRQRLRQLIEEGKRYEEEHGLASADRGRRRRPARLSGEQLVLNLLQSLLRLTKPRYRKHVARLIQALEGGAAE